MADATPEQNAMMAKLRAKYVAELPEKVDDIEDALMTLTRDGDADDGLLDLYRRVHSIKGSAGSYGVPIVSAICHRFEDWINTLREEPERPGVDRVDTGLRFVDLLRMANDAVAAGAEDFEDIEARLDALKGGAEAVGVPAGRRLSVLVLDNARTTVMLLRSGLKDRSVDVIGVDDELDALDRMLAEPFDLIICGLGFGRIGGPGLAAALKLSKGRARRARFVVLASDPVAVPPSSPAADAVLGRGPDMLAAVRAMIDDLAASPPSNDKAGAAP